MSILSANTLFHFTPREHLLDKFENGFSARYNKEFDPELDGSLMESAGSVQKRDPETGELVEQKNPDYSMYIPMVSFCDIPLSSLSFHMNVYSPYGIGLTKDWGEENGLNPVMYVNRESNYFHTLVNTILYNDLFYLMMRDQLEDELKAIREKGLDIYSIRNVLNTNRKNLVNMREQIFTYIKLRVCRGKYKGKFDRYLYYDEKEWRYVPFLQEGPPTIIESAEDLNLENYNKEFRKFPIVFSTQDVKYIIVNSEDDVEFLVKGLSDIKRRTRKYTDEDIHRLTTRIITRKQIIEDF